MPTYYFMATFDGGKTPIFAAEFESLDAGKKFAKRIKDELQKQCPGKGTDFRKITNIRSRSLPRKMRSFSKPKRMTASTIRKMPGVPVQWKINATQKPERRVLARV